MAALSFRNKSGVRVGGGGPALLLLRKFAKKPGACLHGSCTVSLCQGLLCSAGCKRLVGCVLLGRGSGSV